MLLSNCVVYHLIYLIGGYYFIMLNNVFYFQMVQGKVPLKFLVTFKRKLNFREGLSSVKSAFLRSKVMSLLIHVVSFIEWSWIGISWIKWEFHSHDNRRSSSQFRGIFWRACCSLFSVAPQVLPPVAVENKFGL